MIGKLIDFILRERLLIIFLSVILPVGKLFAFKSLNIEPSPAFPQKRIKVVSATRSRTLPKQREPADSVYGLPFS